VAIAAVHPATPYDIPHVARIQRDTWRAAYAELLPAEILDVLDGDDAEQAWEQTRLTGVARLFLATEGAFTVGFCSAGFAPADDVADADDSAPADAATVAMIGTLLVEPRWGRRGHGGRLIATAAHALRNDGATRGIAWIPEADTASRKFYTSIGWRPDGTARTLDAAGTPLREIRFTGPLDLTWKSGTSPEDEPQP
jgi:GNAT superfamily N-acetyltransferase